MIKFSKFVDERFGLGEAGKFQAASLFKKPDGTTPSHKTIYNWYNSNAFWVFEGDGCYRLMEIKAELLK